MVTICGHHYLAMLQLTSNKKLLIKSFFAILVTLFLLITILNNFQFDYSVEISFVALSIVYALIGKIVWHSIAQNISDKFTVTANPLLRKFGTTNSEAIDNIATTTTRNLCCLSLSW
jgi:hypothetical protein